MESLIGKLLWNDEFMLNLNDNSQEIKINAEIEEITEKIIRKLDPNEEKMLKHLFDLHNTANGFENERSFFLGFKAGIKILSEAEFNYPNPLKCSKI